jgi:hypothetical protein
MSAQSVSLERTKVQPVAAGTRASVGSRLLFVDNIRVFLTILALLHHLMIASNIASTLKSPRVN